MESNNRNPSGRGRQRNSGSKPLGEIIKQQRLSLSLTAIDLARASGVSPSHLGRIEHGERYPSAHILRRLAKPLKFEENELFTLAGFLSPQSQGVSETPLRYISNRLDPEVARVLSQEPVEMQRAVIDLLSILKSLAGNINKPRRRRKPKGQV